MLSCTPAASTRGDSISSSDPHFPESSLPPGIDRRLKHTDRRRMSAATHTKVAPAASFRLLADVHALDRPDPGKRASAHIRLEAALGRDFADRLVAALSEEQIDRRSYRN